MEEHPITQPDPAMPEAGVELAELRRPPPCPREALPEWTEYVERCERHGHKDTATQRAVLYYLSGETMRNSAKLAGLRAWQGVCDVLNKNGFRRFGAKTETVIAVHRSVASIATTLLRDQLEENPESFEGRGKELAVIAGISTDKVVAYEASKRGADSGFIQSIGEIALAVAESGSTLSVEIRPPQIEDAIDVTPA